MTSSISIGHLSTFYHTSFILEGTDWLQKAGLDATWKLFASGPDMVRAFENKEIDLGYIGLPPAIIGIARGLSLKCIAGGHVEGTVMIGQPEYKSFDELGDVKKVLEQFVGKTIGTPPKGSIHDVIIKDLIGKLGLSIDVKNYAWADFVLGAMTDKEIDGAVGTPPLAVASRKYAGAKIVIPPHKLWPNNPSYGIVVRNEYMEHRETILKFLEQHERASNLIREDSRKAAEIVSKLTQIVDPESVVEAYKISPKYCAALSKEYVRSTMGFVQVLKDLGYINRQITENEVFDYRFIEKVHPERPHYDIF
ncbi:MAG TPA: ABC transporter substrate-binding protein [Methanocellaceae archaeon]|jgi:NitT/TauT family transport system substrate-binding protein